MINGEATSPDPPPKSDGCGGGGGGGGEVDGGDMSPMSPSQYSSCGESEFERYCSANSVMGTPSICSSYGPCNDFLESEFESLKSFDGSSSLENFSLGRRVLDRNFEGPKGSVSTSAVVSFNGGESSGIDDRADEDSRKERVGCVSGLDSESGLGRDEREEEEEEEEDGLSSLSRYDGSDDDESMYGCGSDDENRMNVYVNKRNLQYSKEVKSENENENPLLINSSVAFGADDWDDFELETGGGALTPLAFDNLQERKEQDLGAERDGLFSSTSAGVDRVPVVGQSESRKEVAEEPVGFGQDEGDELTDHSSSGSVLSIGFKNSAVEQVEEVRDIPVASCQIRGAQELAKDDEGTLNWPFGFPSFSELEEDVKEISVGYNQVLGVHDKADKFSRSTVSDNFEMEQDPLVTKTTLGLGLDIIDFDNERGHLDIKPEDFSGIDDCKALVDKENGDQDACLLSDQTSQLSSHPVEHSRSSTIESSADHKQNSTQLILQRDTNSSKAIHVSESPFEDHPVLVKAQNLEHNEFYDEIVSEMEEILLDSRETPAARFPQGSRMFQSQLSLPPRDGGPTASTSGADDSYSQITQPLRIDGVEVVGAKQKRGDVSLSERLVGVKEYTVYIIRIWSGNNQWEVERRYRDFFTLYRRLKSLSTDQGWTLPALWTIVEKESRKIFGNASPDVVSERSVLIQECLRSIINSGFFSSPPSALLWFLCPQDSFPSSPASETQSPSSNFSNGAAEAEMVSALGKTISLTVEIRPHKSMKQMLEAQHYTCAGCHKHFDDGLTLMGDLVQKLGWGKPRLCEYTGQLFCSSCHTNDTAVLPARVLHNWDFTEYPVSQLAKSYLDSIHEQPMLCVSAVNPFLFSRVPALHHVMGIKKKIGTMLPYLRCPFRRTINKGLGSRRYLLESNDFFALKDLIDLSKGAFAALPVLVETLLRKIEEHIMEQCLICCDVGVPCNARQACNDPSSLIFPFQEGEIERCSSCESVFHKACFRKLTNCSCGAAFAVDETMAFGNKLSQKVSGLMLGRRSSSALPVGLLGGLFSKAEAERDDDNIILMGSLPSTTV